MAKGTFELVIDKLLDHEGGFVNHPKDPGGATNRGITFAVFKAWRQRQNKPATLAALKALTAVEAIEIFKAQYWAPIKGDELPAGLDYATFDFSVNSGPSRAAKELQRVVGAKVDGAVGVMTLAKAHEKAKTDEEGLVKALCARRLSFMKSLKIWSTFGKGWTKRVEEVEINAIQLARKDTLYGVTHNLGGKATEETKSVVKTLTSTVSGAGGSAAAAGVIGQMATETATQLQVVGESTGLKAVQWIFIALTIVGFMASAYAIWAKAKGDAGEKEDE